MSRYTDIKLELEASPKRWLVTGVAGFIGSNIAETLLRMNQEVVGLDNFITGHRRNIDGLLAAVPSEAQARWQFIEGDIRDLDVCRSACQGVDYVLHQAALGSVPRSIEEPLLSHAINVDGFVNILKASVDAAVPRFVYASSSSIYGDEPTLPKVEERLGAVLSPYAATKLTNEIYADVFQKCYEITCVGLRYFNVFGPRQDPKGAYAAVIPKWIDLMLEGKSCVIFGDGETSRDFCYVDNAVQANILAAVGPPEASGAYNVACGERTTLLEMFEMIRDRVARFQNDVASTTPAYQDFRAGDVRHSLANISAARSNLGYAPTHDVNQGMDAAIAWYIEDSRSRTA